jgi:hypothetical protein
MLLFYAILFILTEAVTEGLLKRFNKADFIFDLWIQWVIACFLFGVWCVIAANFDNYYVPAWKLIAGFIFVRFLIFDIAWNIARGVKWNYYGTTKLYDRIMTELASWGWMVKFVLGVMGICFLLGWS